MSLKTAFALAFAALLGLSACSARRIPGTEIEDNDDTRSILKVMETYRTGVEAKDPQKVISVVSESFKDDSGTGNPEDDLDYATLRSRLPQVLSKLDNVKLEMIVRKIEVDRETSAARAVYTYTTSFRMPGLSSKPHSDSEIKEMRFKRVGDEWKITSGI
jgi:hypothetical protein